MDKKTRPGNIDKVVLIGSGKGGVGKTTVSVNLALATLDSACAIS